MNAGIYIVKHKVKESMHIVALNGKEPFIRITNAINIAVFANEKIEKDHKVIEEILENPSDFEFTKLSSNICKSEEKQESKIIRYSDKDYEFFIREENIQPNRELNYVAVVTDIMSRLNVDTAEASVIFNRVNNRYKEFDVKIPSDEP